MKRYNINNAACIGALVAGIVGALTATAILLFVNISVGAAIIIIAMLGSPIYGAVLFKEIAIAINDSREKKEQDKIDFDNFLATCRGKQ